MSDYNLQYPGATIDQLLQKVNNADSAPTANSENLVKSGGVHTALAGKQDKIDAQHKLDYSLLSNTPTIPTVPAISTDISTDIAIDQKTASPKAVATYIPTVAPMLAQGMVGIKLWVGTDAEYALLTPSNDTVYIIKP